MEFLAILLSGLISLVSPVGFAIDRVAEGAIRSQFQSVEQLQVRVDNAPVHQIMDGKVNRVLIAGKGLQVSPTIRIAGLELEAEQVDIDPSSLGQGELRLGKPFQAGVRLTLNQDDINQVIQSPDFAERLRGFTLNFPSPPQVQRQVRRYDFLNPQIRFLDNDRIELSVQLQEQGTPDTALLVAQSGIAIVEGRRIRLLEPSLTVDGQAAPLEILSSITQGVNERFDLANLEDRGITARILQFKLLSGQELDLAMFVHVESQGLAWVQSLTHDR